MKLSIAYNCFLNKPCLVNYLGLKPSLDNILPMNDDIFHLNPIVHINCITSLLLLISSLDPEVCSIVLYMNFTFAILNISLVLVQQLVHTLHEVALFYHKHGGGERRKTRKNHISISRHETKHIFLTN